MKRALAASLIAALLASPAVSQGQGDDLARAQARHQDETLRARRLRADANAIALEVERLRVELLRLGQGESSDVAQISAQRALFIDQPVNVGAAVGQRAFGGQQVTGRDHGLTPEARQLLLVGGETACARLQHRRHRPHQNLGADRIIGPFRRHQQGRRRIASVELKRREQPGLATAFAAQPHAQRRFAVVDVGQPRPLGRDLGDVSALVLAESQ